MEQLFGVIANLGFPIAVSIFLLVRIESKLESLTVSIQTLAQAINDIKS